MILGNFLELKKKFFYRLKFVEKVQEKLSEFVVDVY